MSDEAPIDRRSTKAIDTDRWDRADWERIRREIRELPAATKALTEITPTAAPQMSDVFSIFLKADAQRKDRTEVRDDHIVNWYVDGEAMDLPELRDLHRYTRGDVVAAAMATVHMEPELEILHDRLRTEQQKAEELQRLREQLEELLRQAMQQRPPDDPDGDQGEGRGAQGDENSPGSGSGSPAQGGASGPGEPSLEEQIQALKESIAALEQAIANGLDESNFSVRAGLQSAMSGAADEARTNYENAVTWGLEPGQITRLPADVRLRMAQQLNNPRLRAIAEQFGPLRNIDQAQKSRVVPGLPQEMIGVTIGDDVARLIPFELLRFAEDDLELLFYVDLMERRLQQFRMQGKEKVGRGGIIFCCDCSGSMNGQREIWAKALGLALLNIAKQEHREFHFINFGSPGVYDLLSFTQRSDFSMGNILRVAERFEGGGTDFCTPLDVAMGILQAEHARTGYVESDIVFASDGEMRVPDAWLHSFMETLHEIDGTVWGVMIGNDISYSPSMSAFCEGKVVGVTEFTAKGSRAMADVFKGIRSPGHGKRP